MVLNMNGEPNESTLQPAPPQPGNPNNATAGPSAPQAPIYPPAGKYSDSTGLTLSHIG